MKLLEISVETDGEAAEAVSAVFNQYNRNGTVIEEAWQGANQLPLVKVKTFLSTERSQVVLPKIEEALWHLGQLYPIPSPSVRWLSEADWAEAWKADYTVQHIGKRIVIKPSWLSYTATLDEVVIELDPGLAFGTGLHPSTRLSLEALEQHLKPGDQVLDVGTGSGISAIAAATLGASHVVALDIDDMALQVARENIARNAVERMVSLQKASLVPMPSFTISGIAAVGFPLEEGSRSIGGDQPRLFNASGLWDGAFDLLVMNITADVIAKSAHAIAQCLSIGGIFIVSGIIQSQEELVRQALSAANLTIRRRLIEKDWVTFIGQYPRRGTRCNRKEGTQSSLA
ncbi:MAG: 50S ribosomal protein L11 methyltransferase [Chloroflexi bacterium]|nr:50S ribosomal protein L11 methyltransferase [Chloroflexota bacterium]